MVVATSALFPLHNRAESFCAPLSMAHSNTRAIGQGKFLPPPAIPPLIHGLPSASSPTSPLAMPASQSSAFPDAAPMAHPHMLPPLSYSTCNPPLPTPLSPVRRNSLDRPRLPPPSKFISLASAHFPSLSPPDPQPKPQAQHALTPLGQEYPASAAGVGRFSPLTPTVGSGAAALGSGIGMMRLNSPIAISATSPMSMPNSAGIPLASAAEKPYACDRCDLTFTRQHNLKSHYLTHTEERPFECSECKQQFRRQHDLKRHQKLHTGERPHVCNVCHRSFARLDALNRHMRTEGRSACMSARGKSGSLLSPSVSSPLRTKPARALSPETLASGHAPVATAPPPSHPPAFSSAAAAAITASSPAAGALSPQRETPLSALDRGGAHRRQKPVVAPIHIPSGVGDRISPPRQLSPSCLAACYPSHPPPPSHVPGSPQSASSSTSSSAYSKASPSREQLELQTKNEELELRLSQLEKEAADARRQRESRLQLEKMVDELVVEKELLTSLLVEGRAHRSKRGERERARERERERGRRRGNDAVKKEKQKLAEAPAIDHGDDDDAREERELKRLKTGWMQRTQGLEILPEKGLL
ncbi:uncharacterized protein VTP21DRAFT_6863 [Calcarisporiella thermophila]|uniref:uncharacterized protein n=1 Tax=Calcarisporiella thermophila TaxID=911321 RepID=UPI0037425594